MRTALQIFLCIMLLGAAIAVHSRTRADCERLFQPQAGQPGKDVVWVPTSDALVMRMLQMAQVTAADHVYDLGAGDGKIPIAAAKHFGATAVGIEYDPQLARLAQCYADAESVSQRVQVIQGDIFATDFDAATVITLYLLPELNLRLRPKILQMRPGTRVVSHSFLMGEWQPDERSISEDGHAYLWIVPADVAGTWVLRQQGAEDRLVVRLEQNFQQIDGTLLGERNQPLDVARLRGRHIELAFARDGRPSTLSGEVAGERMRAQVTRAGVTTDYLGSRQTLGQ